MNYGKWAASAIFSASLLALGTTGYVTDAPVAVCEASSECLLMKYLNELSHHEMSYTMGDTNGTAESGVIDESVYVNSLYYGVRRYEQVDSGAIPDGDYVMLVFTQSGARFDFFRGDGGNYIRQYAPDGSVSFYKAVFEKKSTNAHGLASQWLQELRQNRSVAEERGFAGTWADSESGRGTITVKQKDRTTYKVEVVWRNGAAEQVHWEMTASRDGAGRFSYDNCRCVVYSYDTSGSESKRVRYKDGTGSFTLGENDSLTWQDDVGNQGDEIVFVRTD